MIRHNCQSLSEIAESFASRTPAVLRHSGIPVLLLVLGIPLLVQGQMGSMGGGGMSRGGMGSPDPRDQMLQELSKNPVQWKRPEGVIPFWLQNGKTASESTEKLRAKLNDRCDFDVQSVALESAIKSIEERLGIQFELNSRTINESGLDIQEPVTVRGAGPVREILRRILEPMNLALIVHETSIEITTKDAALINPVVRYYDLGFVQSDSKNISAIISTIEQSIEPNIWASAGGSCCITAIGQLLVVSATEKGHSGIEMLLYRLGYPASGEKPVHAATPRGTDATLPGGGVPPSNPFGSSQTNVPKGLSNPPFNSDDPFGSPPANASPTKTQTPQNKPPQTPSNDPFK